MPSDPLSRVGFDLINLYDTDLLSLAQNTPGRAAYAI